jgi:hypothetical protein
MSKFKTNEEYFAFSKRLVVIPSEDIYKLLKKTNIQLPSFIHRFLLKETIRNYVFEERLYNTYSDELKYRLRGYDDFSIYLLEKLIEKYNLDFDVTRYKELLFNFLFLNRDKLKIGKSFTSELEQLQHNYTVDLEVLHYPVFIDMFKDVFIKVNGYIDGVRLELWTDDVLTSYTLGDLKGLAMKYDVKIPRRINKTKLMEILTAKFRLTQDETIALSKMSVLELEMYAKEKGFNISIDLKKSDMIEYLKYALDLYHKESFVDDFEYDIPLFSAVESVVDDIQVEEPEVPEPVEDVTPQVEEEVEPIENQVETDEDQVMKDLENEILEPEPLPVEEEETVIEEEPVMEEEPIQEEPIQEEPENEEIPVPEEQPKEEPRFVQAVDENLLSKEEKDLLDEKINIIIKKYYKKRRRRRIFLIVVITLVVLILGFAAYSYIYYNNINPGNLPFGLPVFW